MPLTLDFKYVTCRQSLDKLKKQFDESQQQKSVVVNEKTTSARAIRWGTVCLDAAAFREFRLVYQT